MRRAMAAAEVGDEQRGEDPTTRALEERVADLLGHEAGIFLPSGTMCNAISFRLHIRPGGDAAFLHPTAHPLTAEAGGPAALSGAVLVPVGGGRGMFAAGEVEAALAHPDDRYAPRSRLVSVEQTTNLAGGHVWPQDRIEDVLQTARRHGLRTHLDGARLLNAVVASGVSAADYARGFDTAWIDLSKGLGCPAGAVLAGSAEIIKEAWRYKQMMGGALRQSGILAAAGLYALDHHVERLADDHANARVLAEGLARIPGVEIDPAEVETNIVVFRVNDAAALCRDLAGRGVAMIDLGPDRVRAVTHLDVDRDGITAAIDAVAQAIHERG